ncbi:RadC family protein [Dyadobacter sp. CY312]|uniref:RadC family protein n=1 Tax=Dyadobacter sp. CY312 TaxID=2907303 RepID=UPI001F361C5D|nr:DNA repair protein RadC [Dyadobacter sp. CY312]MCE7039699.1 DNA repair protein RadC [Dyadobacter sp. CY312]
MANNEYFNPHNIRSWAEEDRPREKLLLKGKAALSDAELVAILINTGTTSLSAVDVAKEMMSSVGNNINELAKRSVKDLMKNKGIGEAKAITIVAALELGRRRKDIVDDQKRKITSPQDIYDEMKPYMMDLRHEEFWILLLNQANIVMKTVRVSSGGVTGTVADSRMIFKEAIEHLASSVILVHNHPSGQLRASLEDKHLTENIVASGHMLGIPVVDHLIFTDTGFYSFVDEGLI